MKPMFVVWRRVVVKNATSASLKFIVQICINEWNTRRIAETRSLVQQKKKKKLNVLLNWIYMKSYGTVLP